MENITSSERLLIYLEPIGSLWCEALSPFASAHPDPHFCDQLRVLAQRALDLLGAAEFDDGQAQDLGAALVRFQLTDPTVLGRTQQVWLEQFPQLLDAAERLQLAPRLARLARDMAFGYVQHLTNELGAANKELRRHALIVDNISDAVVVTDRERRIIDWNPGATRLFGYDKDEVLGRTGQILYAQPENWLPWEKLIERIEDAGIYFFQSGFVRKDGSTGVADTTLVPLRDENGTSIGIVGVNRDVTASTRAEEQLHFQENILGQLNDALIVIDKHNLITHWMGGAERIFGVSEAEALGHRQDELYRFEYLEPHALDNAFAQLVTLGWWRGENKIYRPDGGIRYVDSYARRYRDAQGKTIGIFSITRDITEQKRLVAAIEQRNEELQALNEIADALSATLDTDQILHLIVAYAFKLMNAARVSISVPDESKTEFITCAIVSPHYQTFGGPLPNRSVVGWVYQQREVLQLAHLGDHPWVFAGGDDPESLDDAGLFVPIMRGEEIFGVLVAVRSGDEPFTEREIKLARTLAAHASVALNNARLFQAARKRLDELAALADLSRLCSSSRDENKIIQAGVETTFRLLHCDQCTFRLVEGEYLVPAARRGLVDDPEFDRPLPLSAPWQEFLGGDTEFTIERRDDPRLPDEWKKRLEANPTQSVLIVPMRAGGEALGFLGIGSALTRTWDEEEISLARNIANTVAIALHNARQYQDIANRARTLAELSDLAVQLAASLNAHAIMLASCQRVIKVLDGARSSIRLVDGQELSIGIGVGYQQPMARQHPIPLDTRLRMILDYKTPLVIDDVRLDPQIPSRRLARMIEEESLSFLGVPMQAENQNIGILSVTLAQPHHWTAEEISFVTAVGNVTALALEKAHHHAQALTEREQFRAIVESSQAGLFMLDRAGRVKFSNQAAHRISGWHSDSLQKKNWSDLFVDAEGNASNLFAQLIANDTPSHAQQDLFLRTADRGQIPVDLGLAPMHDQIGEFDGAIGAFTDLSELRAALSIREEFLLNATHDLLTPLSVLVPSLDMFTDPKLSRDKRAQARKLIAAQSRRLKGFAENYMALGRPGTDLALNLDSLDLVAFITRLLTEFQNLETKHHFTFSSNAPAILISADGLRLESVLFNIYTNAVKYSPRGGNIHTTVTRLGRVVRCAVRDEGIGISPEELEHIFDRWHRAATTEGKPAVGHSVGLSLVKRIVTAMGGRTWVESDGKQGSTFFVELLSEPEAQND